MVSGQAKETRRGSERLFVGIVYAVQFFFGGWFFYNGLNHFAAFTPPPPGSTPLSRELIGALNHTGLFDVVKGVELVTGAALLANRFVPLATVVAFPVTLAIAHVMLLNNGGVVGTTVGLLAIALNGLIALGRLNAFLPMLAWKDDGPSSAALRSLPGGSVETVRHESFGATLGLPLHLALIVFGIGAPILIEWATLGIYQGVAAGNLSPEEVVRAEADVPCEFPQIASAGPAVTVQCGDALEIFRVVDGRIAERWTAGRP